MRSKPTPLIGASVEHPGWHPQNLALPRYGKETAPPRIDVKFPILGFLMDSEMTGYDLKRCFQSSVGFFYRTSDGSLYPALKKLARDGLVTMRTEKHGRRARKVYAITPRGRERFLKMLEEPAAPVFVHDEGQVKLYFAHHNPGTALAHMRRMRQFDAAWAHELEIIIAEMNRRGESPFRKVVVEIGRQLTDFKAKMIARLETALANEISTNSRTRNRRLAAANGGGR
jgi:DNA-binding PadR family transcriptional regulator